jgi:enoyl-CoA hydratase/carnithine racemase
VKLAGDVAILRLNNGKANAIDVALLEKLERFLDSADTAGARAIVITGYDRYFSAGLALPSLIAHDRDQMRSFINRFSEVMLHLYACPLPMIAAVNGHAVAGGCVLALMADRRLMVDEDAKIGLNEVQLGIGLPSSVIEPLRAAVPPASLGPIALEGRLFQPDAALALGLVDELIPRAELEARATALGQAMADLPPAGFRQVKDAFRRPVLEAARRTAVEETERWLESWFSEGARHRIVELVGKLTKEVSG